MEGTMSDVNDEMKAVADYAIKSAKERFGQVLDFSEQSIALLENILEKIYWGFSSYPKEEEKGGVIFNTAVIWGSFLGEYMRLKWGGKWVLKGSDPLVSITNIEFSPINLIYQKITTHPEYRVENYLSEANRKLYKSAINPKQSQSLSENIRLPKKQVSTKPSKKPVAINKRLLFTLAGIGGILLVLVAYIIGYSMIKPGGISAFGLIAPATSLNTNIPLAETLVTATSSSTSTQVPTATPMPTYTPNPTITPRPSYTPSLTYTQIPTLAPTDTQTPFVPTRTRTPRNTPTSVPTDTAIPPTQPPPPPPTATEPAPIVIASCEIDPITVPVNNNTAITFIVHFSSNALGYGFQAIIDPIYNGQSGCSGTDDDGDGMAYCDGLSGELPDATTVNVTLRSSVGDCVVSYSSR
jgi:hypothetical protein